MNIEALSEVRRLGSGSAVAEAYSYHWSGPSDVKLRGVGTAISARLRECVRLVTPVDERILANTDQTRLAMDVEICNTIVVFRTS